MIKGSIDSIETFGLVDGPGIRTVVFLNGCKLRCKYCHNPETWTMRQLNYTPSELVDKIKRYKSYFGDNGGVTFSGGEPLIQSKFLLVCLKLLKEDNINVALDTAGVGNGDYEEILNYVDLILFDVKHVTEEDYYNLTGKQMSESLKFIEIANKLNKKFWIRQVIVPGLMDNIEYITNLAKYLQKIKNIERIDFLPYHRLGSEKYAKLGISYPFKDLPEMDKARCNELYQKFIELYEKEQNR